MRTYQRVLLILGGAVTTVATLLSINSAAQSAPDTQLRYNVYYQCNGERIAVGHCRKDGDIPGAFPTTEQQNYCLVYYPDRPGRGATMVQASELRGDIIRKLQACGALNTSQPQQAQPSGTPKTSTPPSPKTTADAQRYLAEGKKYREAKDFAKAADAYKKAIAINPNMAEAYRELAYMYSAQNEFQPAIATFKQCLVVAPSDVECFLRLGDTYLDVKQYAQALEAYQGGIHVKPDADLSAHATYWMTMTETNYEVGRVYVELKQYQNALAPLQTAIRLNADPRTQTEPSWMSPLASAQLGWAYFNLGQYPNAVAAYKQAIDLSDFLYDGEAKDYGAPAHSQLYYLLGFTYVQMNKKEDALQVYKALLPLDRAKARQLYELINKGQANNPGTKTPSEKDADAYLEQAGKYRLAGEYPKAIEAYKKVIALAPNSGLAGDAYHGMGWIDLEQKNYQIAVTNLNEALRLRPEDAEVNFECGEAFMYNGILPRAIGQYKEAIRLQPDFAGAYYYLGLTYDMMGDKQEAMQVYQKLKGVDKKTAQELYNQIQKSK